MTSRDQSKLTMYSVVEDYLTTNASVVSGLPNYTPYFSAFTGGIDRIQSLVKRLLSDHSGLTISKDKLKIEAAVLAADSARKIKAYARFIKNDLMESQVDYSDWELKKAPDATFPAIVKGIYDLAQSNLEALTPYGITAATQTALSTALTAYETASPKRRSNTSDDKQINIQLAKAFSDTNAALEELTILFGTIKLQQPNFWNGFKSACDVVVTGTRSLAVIGLITDAATGDPLKSATITFVPDGSVKGAKSNGIVVKKSATKGGFNIKTMTPGGYTVTVKKSGYADNVLSITVSEGELTRITVALTHK